MSYFKKFGTGQNGQFWSGDVGFLYKKSGGGGVRRNPSIGLICNKPTYIYNKYKPGTGGVGASTVSNRRAKNRLATVCTSNNNCGKFYNYLGLGVYYPIINPIPTPEPPIPPILQGTVIYTFNLLQTNFSQPVSLNFIQQQYQSQNLKLNVDSIPIPFITNGQQLTYTKQILQNGTSVTVIIKYQYYSKTTDTNDGFSFYTQDGSTVNYYNNNTSDLTIQYFNGAPFSKSGSQFAGLTNFTFGPNSGSPNLLPNTSLNRCFSNCINFNQNISNWDYKNITDMAFMFQNATAFNQSINSWDVSKVINMTNIFYNATSFNNGESSGLQPITFTTGSYDNASLTLTCTGSSFLTDFVSGDILIIEQLSSLLVYSSVVATISSNTSLTLTIPYGSSFTGITSIKKSIPGTTPIEWKTINVKSMAGMFYGASSFNQPLSSNFVTNKVTTIFEMFRGCFAFNQSVSNFDTSNVRNKSGLFRDSYIFNQSVNNFDTSQVTDISFMFSRALLFNQSVSNFNTSKVRDMSFMFYKASVFNQSVSNFDTSNVTNISYMFYGATLFNQNIGSWNVTNVTDMTSTFQDATAFNNGESSGLQPITFTTGSYDNASLTLTCTGSSFLTDFVPGDILIIEKSSTSLVYSSVVATIFSNTSLTLTIPYGSSFTDITSIKKSIPGTSPITWNTGNVTSMAGMFYGASSFNQPLSSSFITNKVNTMSEMFRECFAFNQPVSNFNTSNVTNMEGMFRNAYIFNQPVSNFNTSQVTSFSSIFNKARLFNQSVSNFNTSNATNMSGMFQATFVFNQSVSNFDTSNVINMSAMFYQARIFNQSVSNFNTQNVTNMSFLFSQASLFNQSVSNFDTSKVTTMFNMFNGASSFNQSVSNFNTSNVTTMFNMFAYASVFNQSVSNFNTQNVTTMQNMFAYASVFNQNISSWNVSNVTNMANMFQATKVFNNGESGTQDITGNATTAYYTTSGSVLTCPDTTIIPQLSINDVIIITTSTIVYTSKIASITSSTTLTLTPNYGANIGTALVPIITSIKKQVVGSAPLNWNTTSLPDLQYMFSDATYFNQDVSSFTVSNATHMFSSTTTLMRGIFNNGQLAGSNNNSLQNWNTVASGSTGAMFLNSAGFNQNISNWNVSNVIYTGQMFQGALVYNNGDAPGLSTKPLNSWNTSKFGDIQVMFNGAIAFNQNISAWDVSNVTNMNATFQGTSLFNNGDTIGSSNNPLSWNAPKCVNFERMFRSAPAFNQDISNLVNTSSITAGTAITMNSMFENAISFNRNISNWNTSKVTIMSSVFSGASVFNNGEVTNTGSNPLNWITDNVNTMSGMFVNATVFNQPINTSGNYWNTGNVTTMFQMLATTGRFNQPIGNWDVSKVTSMGQMFYGAVVFNQNISLWKTGNVTTMFDMFRNATVFNQPINTNGDFWNVNNVTNMSQMFRTTNAFNQDIGSWNVSNVTDMTNMFNTAIAFNNGGAPGTSLSPLSWSADKCILFGSMFGRAQAFNQQLPNLVKSSATSLDGMFQSLTGVNACLFNQNISSWSWDLSNVTNMSFMFFQASNFNNGGFPLTLSAPKCTTFVSMFQSASAFNQPLPNLVNTSGIALPAGCSLTSMFQSAVLFNQNINTFNTINVASMATMFLNATVFNNGSLTNDGANPLLLSAPNCVNFSSMFQTSGFNQNVNNLLATSNVSTNLTSMFQSNKVFNNGETGTQDITGTASTATYVNSTKVLTLPGGQFLSQLTLSDVLIITSGTTIIYTSQIQTISSDTSLVLLIPYGANFNAGTITTIKKQVAGTADLNWNTSNVTNIASLFLGAYYFNQRLPWNMSNVTNMSSVFSGSGSIALRNTFNNGQLAGSSTQPLTNVISNFWITTKCTTFLSMFAYNSGFNQPIPNLVNTSSVVTCSLNSMFSSASVFNQNVSSWNTINVTDMINMFFNTTLFNNGSLTNDGASPLTSWSAPNCTLFSLMFSSAIAFNQDISNLVNTTNVASCLMTSMFSSAFIFNNGESANINNWITTNVTNMSSMFASAYVFNQPIGSWNTGNVTTMSSMFSLTRAFNQNIGSWNTANVTTMASMFAGTTSLATTNVFNNGEISGLQNISSITLNTSSYATATNTLTCPGATLLSQSLSAGDTVVIGTSTILYSSTIQTLTDTTITFNALLNNANIAAPLILLVKKSNPGTSPLLWNTSKVTTMSSMFQYCINFNQNITTSGSYWNTNLVSIVISQFQGINATTGKGLFNNGQVVGGTTAPMGWVFNVAINAPNQLNFRTNSNLTTANKPALLT